MAFEIINDPSLMEQLGDPQSEAASVPFATRLGASIKMTPQGRIGYLESKYGEGNVAEQNGNILIRQDGQWQQFDEEETTLNDVADLAGGAIEFMPPFVAGLATANPLAVGAAGGAGNSIRQSWSNYLPGDDQMTTGDRLGEMGTTAAIETGAQAAGNLLFRGLDKARPHNLMANALNRVPNQQFAQEGARLENWMRQDASGFGFTMGQQTGSRGRLMIEGLGRRHVLAADDLAALDRQQIADSVQKFNAIMDRITPNQVSPTRLGDEIKNGYKRLTDDLIGARSKQGKVDFNRAWMMAKGQKNIRLTNTLDQYYKVLDDFGLEGSSGGVDALVGKAGNWLEAAEGGPVSAKTLQKMMERLGKVKAGKATLFSVNSMPMAGQREVAGRLLRALNQDLDDAIQTGVEGADLLRVARDNWRMNSDAISQVKDTVLGRLLKQETISPERLVEKIQKMRPSELTEVSKVLSDISPDIYNQTKRAYLESFKAKSKVATSVNDAAMTGDLNLSSSKLATLIRDHADEINAFFGKGEAQDMDNMLGVLSRLSDRAKTEGSPTGTINMLFKSAGQMMSLNPMDWIRSLATLLGPRQLVKLVVDPQARKSLMTIKESKNWTKGATAALGYLSILLNDDDGSDLTMPPQTLLSGQNLLSQ